MAAKDSKTLRAGWYWSCASKYCKNWWKTSNVECTESGSQVPPKVKQEHWHCAAMLCTNFWCTKNKDLKYYRLKEIVDCPQKRRKYNKILKNKGIDLKRDFICSVHRSKGERENLNDLPDLPWAPEFAEREVTNKTTPVSKINCAKRCIQRKSEGSKVKKRRVLSYSSCNEPPCTQILQKKIDDLKEKLRTKTIEVNQLSEARFIRRTSAVSNAIETIDNEMICFIIFCLNSIRRGRNATYEPGLIWSKTYTYKLKHISLR